MWNVDGIGSIVFPTVSTVILFFVTVNVVRYLVGELNINVRDKKIHKWQPIDRTTRVMNTIYSTTVKKNNEI